MVLQFVLSLFEALTLDARLPILFVTSFDDFRMGPDRKTPRRDR